MDDDSISDGRRRRSVLSKKRRPTLEDSSDSEPEYVDDSKTKNDSGSSDKENKEELNYSPERMKAALKLLSPVLTPSIDSQRVGSWEDVVSMKYCLVKVKDADEIVNSVISSNDKATMEFRCLLCEASRNLSKKEDKNDLKLLYKKIAGLISGTWVKESLDFYKVNDGSRVEKNHAHVLFMRTSLQFMIESNFSKSAKHLEVLKNKRDMPWEDLSREVLELGRNHTVTNLVSAGTKAQTHFQNARRGINDTKSKAPGNEARASGSTAAVTGALSAVKTSISATPAVGKTANAKTARLKRMEEMKRKVGALHGTPGDPPVPAPAAASAIPRVRVPSAQPSYATSQQTPSRPEPSHTPAQGSQRSQPSAEIYKADPEADLSKMTMSDIMQRFTRSPQNTPSSPTGWENPRLCIDKDVTPSTQRRTLWKNQVSSLTKKSFRERELDQVSRSRRGDMSSYQRPQDQPEKPLPEDNRPKVDFKPRKTISRQNDLINDQPQKRTAPQGSDPPDQKRPRYDGDLRGDGRGRPDYSSSHNEQPGPAFNRNDGVGRGRGRGRGREQTMPAWMARAEAQQGFGQAPPGGPPPQEYQQPPPFRPPPDRPAPLNVPPPRNNRPPAAFPQGPPGGGRGRGRGKDQTLPAWVTRDQTR